MRDKAAVLDAFNWRKTHESAGVRTFSHPLHPGHKIRVIEDQWTHEGPGDYTMEHGSGHESLRTHCEKFHGIGKSEPDNEIVKSMVLRFAGTGFHLTTFTAADADELKKSRMTAVSGETPLSRLTIRRHGFGINPVQQFSKGAFQYADVDLWLTKGAKLELRTRLQKAVFAGDPKVHPDSMIEFDGGSLRESVVTYLFRDAAITKGGRETRGADEIRKSAADTAGARIRAAAQALDDLVDKQGE
jgi:hypothetical protein